MDRCTVVRAPHGDEPHDWWTRRQLHFPYIKFRRQHPSSTISRRHWRRRVEIQSESKDMCDEPNIYLTNEHMKTNHDKPVWDVNIHIHSMNLDWLPQHSNTEQKCGLVQYNLEQNWKAMKKTEPSIMLIHLWVKLQGGRLTSNNMYMVCTDTKTNVRLPM